MKKEHTITSLEVARMAGRRHSSIMRDIRRIIDHLGEHKSVPTYFYPASYMSDQKKRYECFRLTKKGCELFGTRMTGKKGTEFARAFVEKFYQLELEWLELRGLEENYDELDEDEADLLESGDFAKDFEADDFSFVPAPLSSTEEPALPATADARTQLQLMYRFGEETATRVDSMETRLKDLTDESQIDAGTYQYLTQRIADRVKQAERSFGELTREKRKLLYIDINSGVKRVAGVGCRSNLRRKHYDKVLDFVNFWEPSSATKALLRESGAGA